MRLRDETDRVASRVQRSRRAKDNSPGTTPADSPRTPPLMPASDALVPVSPATPEPSHFPITPADDLAICYFMTSFIEASPFQTYLPELYAVADGAEDILSTSLQAAAHATFALRTGDRRHLDIGRQNYVVALRKTNAAISDPVTAVLDSTLAAILLLGVFESTAFAGKKKPEEWTAHTLGALRLQQLRGLRQFESDIAARMFAHTSSNIRASCVQREVEVPPEFRALSALAEPFLDPRDPSFRLAPILDKVASIRTSMAKLGADGLTTFIEDSLSLDRDAEALISPDETELAPTMICGDKVPSWAYLGLACHYPSRRAAKFWNGIRMIRLFLNEVIWTGASTMKDQLRKQTNPSSLDRRIISYYEALMDDTVTASEDIATQVLASVPEFVEPGPNNQQFLPSARTLVWPLNLITTCPICSGASRKHARAVLEDLGVELNRFRPPESFQSEDWRENW